ncbi:MAG: copper-binding protein [Actinobacteria bacterium]|nr:MAG: copper-binding protein [Actinomycetota bacterium]
MRRVVLVLLAPAALFAAGCGGNSGSGANATTGQAAAPVAKQTLKVSEKEFSITPASFTVAKPGTYSFAVSNDGKIAHALVIEGQGSETKTGTIAPGSSTRLVMKLPKAGKYELYCPIDGHRGKGMRATLTVQGAGSSPGMNGTSPAPTTTNGTTTSSGGYGY